MAAFAGAAARGTPPTNARTRVGTQRRSDREHAIRTERAHPLAGRSAVRLRAALLQLLRCHALGRGVTAVRRQLDRLALSPGSVLVDGSGEEGGLVSVEVIATRRPIARRSGDLPCRASADDTAWTVMIRVGDRTFTSDCQDHDEAIEAAKAINAELSRHFGGQQ